MTDSNSTTDNTATFAADGTLAGIGADNIDYQKMYESQREENERLSAVITAGRLSPVADSPDKNRRPPVTAQRLRSMLGELGFQRASRAEKLAGLGLNHAEVSDAGLKKLFGRGNQGKESSDLYKTNPYKYRQLREAAIVLDIFAA